MAISSSRHNTLMNLGVVSMQEEHYEDALVRFDDAATLARSIGAKLALEKAAGNMGSFITRLAISSDHSPTSKKLKSKQRDLARQLIKLER